MLVGSQTRFRILFVMAVLSAIMLILAAQLVRWQILKREELLDRPDAIHQGEISKPIPSRRGSIYDRNGFLLAADVVKYEVSASLTEMSQDERQLAVQELSPLLGVNPDELAARLNSDGDWASLEPEVSLETGEKVKALGLPHINVDESSRRVYPAGSLASHVLGFVSLQKAGFKSNYGVETYYETVLQGRPGSQKAMRDPRGNAVPIGQLQYVPPEDGKDLYLTIDRTAQYVVENELQRAVQKYEAESGTVVVLHPRTGAILAMAGWPTYDPNNYAQTYASQPEVFANPAVSDQYEPGSVFKVVTMAAGLDSGVITPESTVIDPGEIEVGGQTIYDWDRQPHGTVDMVTVLGKSLNVGSAQVAVKMGKDRFYSYVQRFGFGSLTDVDLYGERPGKLRTPGDPDWYESDLGTNSFGQGVAATPLQVALAVGAVANDGILMRPYVVQRIVNTDDASPGMESAPAATDGDAVRWIQPEMVSRVISPETSHTLTQMMVLAVERDTQLARVPGYRVAGKSGTAQIYVPGGYDPDDTIASFVGYLPADDPALLILVVINRPQTSIWGGQVAAPVFASIASQLATAFSIPPDEIRHQLAGQQIGMAIQ